MSKDCLCYSCQNIYYDAMDDGYCTVTKNCVITDHGCSCTGCSHFLSLNDGDDYVVVGGVITQKKNIMTLTLMTDD